MSNMSQLVETLEFAIPKNLHRFERKIYSQFGEDGVLATIFATLKITRGTFLEIGIGPPSGKPVSGGLEGNCLLLRNQGWTGTWIDGASYPSEFCCKQHFVTALNVNELFEFYNITLDLDCMSIDTDGREYWIWDALTVDPKVMVIEYNGGLGPDRPVTMPFDPTHVWDGTRYHGASLAALNKLAQRKHYLLVWANGVNAAFIRKDLVANPEDFSFSKIFRGYPPHRPDSLDRQWISI